MWLKNNFDGILGNTFLDAYEIDIFHSRNKVKIYAKIGFKLMNLDVNYSFMLAEVRINLVSFVKKLESPNFYDFDVFDNLQKGA